LILSSCGRAFAASRISVALIPVIYRVSANSQAEFSTSLGRAVLRRRPIFGRAGIPLFPEIGTATDDSFPQDNARWRVPRRPTIIKEGGSR
jgi:hypothetical protein